MNSWLIWTLPSCATDFLCLDEEFQGVIGKFTTACTLCGLFDTSTRKMMFPVESMWRGDFVRKMCGLKSSLAEARDITKHDASIEL